MKLAERTHTRIHAYTLRLEKILNISSILQCK
jgi:hypothetical protein